MAANVPLTLQTMISNSGNSYYSLINIGKTALTQPANVPPATPGYYWIVVLDRSDLSVKLNINFQTNNVVPPALSPFIQNPGKYIMILTTIGLSSANLPTGAFYNFLVQEGSGAQLNTLEQIFAAFNCGTWGRFGYTMVTVLDNVNSGSFEFGSITGWALVSTLLFSPIQIGPQILYTPIAVR
jgi:hypothetical protein